jgi:hypothetical protein
MARRTSSFPLLVPAVLPLLLVGLLRCSDEDPAPVAGNAGTAGAAGQAGSGGAGEAGAPSGCQPPCFDAGDPVGHTSPEGALAAGQARAGRIAREDQIHQPTNARQKVRVGDYLLVNDKIGVYIEDKGLSDGYARFGGGILAIDRIGPDGLPDGTSQYIEQLLGVSGELVDPDSVTVLNDGSDGQAAVVRAVGTLRKVPFAEAYKVVFPHDYGLKALYDYILEPGSEVLKIRLGIINDTEDDIEVPPQDEAHAPLHYQRAQVFTPTRGYDTVKGKTPWVGYDAGSWSFAFRSPRGDLSAQIDLDTFQFFAGKGYALPKGQPTFVDVLELVAGGPHLDGMRATVARAFENQPWVGTTGTVVDATGAPVVGAWLLEEDAAGLLLSRTKTDSSGVFTIHGPAASTVRLRTVLAGYTPTTPSVEVATGAEGVKLTMAPHGLLHVHATVAGSATNEPLPVRIQVVPETPPEEPPPASGLPSEARGRLVQAFEMAGDATFALPPGKHRVFVSHGYEWELLDTTVDIVAGATVEVLAPLVHSVASPEVMCGDFHIHSFYSQDARDPVEFKVRGAVADGLDIACSSEHDWIFDFAPVVADLGVGKWTFGMGSEELSTLRNGHFGVIPMARDRAADNDGAVDWFGKTMPELFDYVHALPSKPILVANHPSDTGFGKGYFFTSSFNRETGVGKDGVWSDHFDAVEVFNGSDYDDNRKSSVADTSVLLAKGKKLVFLGNSDSHLLRDDPIGYPRTCIRFGHEDPTKLSASGVRDGLASGDVVVSGGLFLDVRGPKGERPGATIATQGEEITFTVRVAAPSWVAADSLEMVLDGAEVGVSVPLVPVAGAEGPGKLFENQVKVKRDPQKPVSWVVFHAKGSGDLSPVHPGKKPFAASSPIWLD